MPRLKAMWGTGTPKTEFFHVDDLAEACVFLMQRPDHRLIRLLSETNPPLINIECGHNICIKELSEL